jgi:hypothetical protein
MRVRSSVVAARRRLTSCSDNFFPGIRT